MTAKLSRMCRFCSRVSEGLAEIAGSGGGASRVKDMGATRCELNSRQHGGEPLRNR